jgi:hypothetical protein
MQSTLRAFRRVGSDDGRERIPVSIRVYAIICSVDSQLWTLPDSAQTKYQSQKPSTSFPPTLANSRKSGAPLFRRSERNINILEWKRMGHPAGNWGGPNESPGLLLTFNTLVVLMDLGLDPASKQSHKMIDRVEKRLVFKYHNNRRFFEGETEPCINGRIIGLGARTSTDRITRWRTNCSASNSKMAAGTAKQLNLRQNTAKPALFVPHHHLRTRRTARIRTSGAQIGVGD